MKTSERAVDMPRKNARSLAYRLERDPRVCLRPLADEWASREISLCWLKDEEEPSYVGALRLALKDAAAALERRMSGEMEPALG